MDNASIHRSPPTKDLEKAKSRVVYNISYHPESNPIEHIFHVIKEKLRKKIIRNEKDLLKHLRIILNGKFPQNIFYNCFVKSFSTISYPIH